MVTEVMSYKQPCPAAIACNKEEQQEEVDDRSVVSDLTYACCCELQQLQEEEEEEEDAQGNIIEEEEEEGNDDGTVNLQISQHLNDDDLHSLPSLSLSLSSSFTSSLLKFPFLPSMSTMSMPTTMTSDVCY